MDPGSAFCPLNCNNLACTIFINGSQKLVELKLVTSQVLFKPQLLEVESSEFSLVHKRGKLLPNLK